uniref:Uncharacterized protein n=1 Tax=Glossina brevipalpis TaxID=37001 RepID=A0A1A9W7Z6_9MUSC
MTTVCLFNSSNRRRLVLFDTDTVTPEILEQYTNIMCGYEKPLAYADKLAIVLTFRIQHNLFCLDSPQGTQDSVYFKSTSNLMHVALWKATYMFPLTVFINSLFRMSSKCLLSRFSRDKNIVDAQRSEKAKTNKVAIQQVIRRGIRKQSDPI